MIRVGLTGGIGAGKSTVATTFIERGGYHVDADKIAREVVEPGSEGLRGLVEAFGGDILAEDGTLNRPALAAKAFVDDEQRQKLNSITHPLIAARTQELLDAAPADAIVVHDIPLLVENHTAPFFHLVIIVGLDAEIRVQRLTTQRGLTEADARARIAAQATDAQRREVADVWLDNSGTPEELAAAAQALWDDRLAVFEANVRADRVAEPVAGLIADDPNPSSVGSRLTNRLWALCGDKASAVNVTREAGDANPVELTVTARDSDAASGLSEVLPAGGFAHDTRAGSSTTDFASSDPGRPATVHIITP